MLWSHFRTHGRYKLSHSVHSYPYIHCYTHSCLGHVLSVRLPRCAFTSNVRITVSCISKIGRYVKYYIVISPSNSYPRHTCFPYRRSHEAAKYMYMYQPPETCQPKLKRTYLGSNINPHSFPNRCINVSYYGCLTRHYIATGLVK